MIHQLDFKAMGCRMTALVETPEAEPPILLGQVPAWFEEWEQVLSRFRAESELNQLNRMAGWPVQVSQTLWDVFLAAYEAELGSGGLVTPAILDSLVAAGYDRSFDQLRLDQTVLWLPQPKTSSLGEVVCDETTRSLCLPIDLKLDFGGVAKGWAAHQAAKRLAGCGPALVNAGGDLEISAEQSNGTPWPISVDDPFQPGEMLGLLMVKQGGVATSGTDYRRWKQGGQWNHHIINPQTGLPAQTDVLAATVIAPDGLQAEMAAKVALISGSDQGLAWIESRSEFAALLVLESGEVLLSQQMQKHFWRAR